MALGDKRRAESIRATRKEAGKQEGMKRVVIAYSSQNKRKTRSQKKRYNFSLRYNERQALTELTDLLGEKSDSEVLGKLILRAYKAASDPEFNSKQTDIFDFL
ncbi:MAG TPA: hypothetical protein DCZ00_04440 [Lactococcus sp.]|uniref:hypothetical protein n=1 Tax=Lactococcus TaxID=1357 RepID=UPI000E86DA14|nr:MULTISPECIES: hypothetical protein [Lactococcus]HBC90677.1 hypothetical protein [Lactococcus sp.]